MPRRGSSACLVTLWGFPFETAQWRSLILLVCQVSLVVSAPSLWSQHGSRVPESRQPDTCTREETLRWAATHERKALRAAGPEDLISGIISPQADR